VKEYLVIGPPGCGKTTYVARQARRAVEKFGPKSVLICSLTKAAANEAAGRDTGVAEEMVGTLHSHCFRALRSPKIVESKHIKEWNAEFPLYALSHDSGDEVSGYRAHPGDRIMQSVDLHRSRMTPAELWKSEAANFYRKWSEWKSSNGLVDFTDLLEMAVNTLPIPPGSPQVLIGDEGQDFSRLEVTLLRKWSQFVDMAMIVGDPDQSLYHWRGADPEILSRPGLSQGEQKSNRDGDTFRDLLDSDGNVIGSVRSKSFRVPRAVHGAAVRLIERIPGRTKIDYEPTAEKGEVLRTGIGSNRFDFYMKMILDSIRDRNAIPVAQRPHSPAVMILSSCEFMLRPIIKSLRAAGIPYGNPYTDRWNPLKSSGTSMKDRLLAFLRPQASYFGDRARFWTVDDIKAFASCLRTSSSTGGVLSRGAKKGLESLPEDTDSERLAWIIREIFTAESLPHLTSGDVNWFASNLLAKDQETVKFPMEILKKFGVDALEGSPSVCVGTIHSVKGGEADTVIVFPDLSPSGYDIYRIPGWGGHDSVLRLYYVAMTRARRRLVIGAPSSGMYVNL
jgi:DNA helicase-2/ATP-dependent DNA helicase PcrA